MPRRSHRPDRHGRPAGSGQAPRVPETVAGWQRQQSTADGDFLVRTVPGARSTKIYRCPGCQQEIRPGTAHLVVWPAWTGAGDAGVAQRRHWHTQCWQRRAARGGPGRPAW